MKFHSFRDVENKVPKRGSFKHFLQMQENGGRVVKGVNTTADVGVDAIKKQAAKFGNKVDKDGRPPTLSKKVKGSKTNVLFNLGMTESKIDVSYDKWDHEKPVSYSKYLEKHFGNPDEFTNEQTVWHNKDGFKRIVCRDEYILHTSPAPHYDFVYCYVDLEVPENLSDELANCSGSILIDHLKNEVGARCGSLTANATTINFVMDVVAGRAKPVKEVYEKRILDMMDMSDKGKHYKLDWWPDQSGDADPKNPYYKESVDNIDVLLNLGLTESKNPALYINQALQLEARAEAIWKRTVGRQFPWPDGAGQRLIHIGKVIQAKQDPKKFIRDLNINHNKFISFIQRNKFPTETIPLLRQIQKLVAKLVDNTDESMLYYAKMAEDLGELASTSKVFVDMDGVLADFFGEWQKLIGKDWRKVKDIEPALQKIRDKDDFWLNLPLLPQAKNLLGVIKKVKGSYSILSSPLPNDPNSEPHKREWIKKNLDFFPPENVIITHDKAKFATNPDGTPNILIDDFGKNIASWEAAGGEGFKHKDHKFERTAKAIQQHMKEPVAEDTQLNEYIQYFKFLKHGSFVLKIIKWFWNNKWALAFLTVSWKTFKWVADAVAWLKGWADNPIVRGLARYGMPAVAIAVALYGGKKLYDELVKAKDEKDLKKLFNEFEPDTNDLDNLEKELAELEKEYQNMKEPVEEKAVSKKQQQFFGIVRAMQKGDMKKGGEAGEVAKDMKKSDVKKFASTKHKGLPKKKKSESYTRDQLPQIRKKHLEYIPHKIVSIKVESIVPVQKERLKENYTKQLKKIAGGEYAPIIVDSTNRIINGHHRYDVVKMLQMESITVAKLPYTLEFVLGMMKENFADGKKKGKSRPGRVKKSGASCNGSVTSLRSKAKKASGEKAKMYHWCANMKSGRKKSESLYTEQEFINILMESTPKQLDEGIKDLLTKLPKNILSKVKPILSKIPKHTKNFILVPTLLAVMVNAVAAGDMGKVDVQMDKLNNMASISSTMDDPNKGDPDVKNAVPDKIKILKMPTAPDAPSSDTPDGTNDKGVSIDTTKDGNRTVASGAGTYTFTPDGKLIKYESPKIKGLQQVHDFVKKTVTQDFHAPVNTGDGEVGVDLKGIYDMDGNKLKGGVNIGAGAASVGIDVDGHKHFNFDAGGGKSYKMSTKDMGAAKKTMGQMQKDLNIAKDTSAPYSLKTT